MAPSDSYLLKELDVGKATELLELGLANIVLVLDKDAVVVANGVHEAIGGEALETLRIPDEWIKVVDLDIMLLERAHEIRLRSVAGVGDVGLVTDTTNHNLAEFNIRDTGFGKLARTRMHGCHGVRKDRPLYLRVRFDEKVRINWDTIPSNSNPASKWGESVGLGACGIHNRVDTEAGHLAEVRKTR